jgi:hypothetical protein
MRIASSRTRGRALRSLVRALAPALAARSGDAPSRTRSPPPTASYIAGVRTTPRVAAPCGPDWLERHATSVSDRQTRRDDTHARAFDLGDGTASLRIRSAADEYYVVSVASRIRSVPPCLE